MLTALTNLKVIVLAVVCHSSVDTIPNKKPHDTFFSEWFMDMYNGGQFAATSRLATISVGESGKFSVPLSLYSGITNNNPTQYSSIALQPNNNQLGPSLLDPLSGSLNLSSHNFFSLLRSASNSSALGIFYQGAVRLLSGFQSFSVSNALPGESIRFVSGIATMGCYLQTRAWQTGQASKEGACKVLFRYTFIGSNKNAQAQMFEDYQQGMKGWSASCILGLDNRLQVRFVINQFLKSPEVFREKRYYQFSVSYSPGASRN